ncbi:MAG: S49 family peptidase [Flavobacteriaceae bacterium]|nr:S49 family peptidase [Flavobacteriaceae bacterium]
MKKNTLNIAAALRGPWMFDQQSALSFAPLLAHLIKGDTSQLYEKIEARYVNSVISPSGKTLTSGEDVEEGSIGVIHIDGPMFKNGTWWAWGSDELMAMAEAFDNNSNIIGQIWRTNSGGGQVAAVAPYLDFHANRKKPVVELVDICASAAIWKAAPADFIMAENDISSAIGSIGVMTELQNWDKYFEQIGLEIHTIFADQSSEKGSAYADAKNGDYKKIKEELLNPLASKFQETIKKHRGSKLDLNVDGLLKGKMFFAEDAQAAGLIDGIGNFDAAIRKVKELSAVQDFMNQ